MICHDFSSEIEQDFKYSEDDFTYENYTNSIQMLRETIPEWMEEVFQKNKEFPDLYDSLFQGDIFLAYYNHTNNVQGYVLKLEYLQAKGSAKEDMRKRFCDFLIKTHIYD